MEGGATGERYPSLASLRAAHGDLLKRYRERGDVPELLAEMEALIRIEALAPLVEQQIR